MASLRDWRQAAGLTLDEVASRLEIVGVKPGRTVQRLETGERSASLEMALTIERMTGGAVTPADMRATRMAWLLRDGLTIAPVAAPDEAAAW